MRTLCLPEVLSGAVTTPLWPLYFSFERFCKTTAQPTVKDLNTSPAGSSKLIVRLGGSAVWWGTGSRVVITLGMGPSAVSLAFQILREMNLLIDRY